MTTKTRAVLSTVALMASIMVGSAINAFQTIGMGIAAGGQLDPSNAAYLGFAGALGLSSILSVVPFGILAISLLFIWYNPIKTYLVGVKAAKPIAVIGVLSLLGLIGVGIAPKKAGAYYDKSDRAEVVWIKPNQSAFWIPDVGDNKSSQNSMSSKAYLEERKVAAKRFTIPHVKLHNSTGSLESDYFVPAGRLILLDRSPAAREWVSGSNKGTSSSDQSFECQTSEGINVSFGISASFSLSEENSPTFLYKFGVAENSSEDQSDPNVKFRSVQYGRSLNDITDHVVRRFVHTQMCKESSSRTFDVGTRELNLMVSNVEAKTKEFAATSGITLEFLGLGSTVTFDQAIQDAINKEYASRKIAASLPVLERENMMSVRSKWNGSFWGASGSRLEDSIGKLFGVFGGK